MNTINAHKSCGFAWIWELCLLFTGFYSGHQLRKTVKQFLIRLMSQFSVTSLWKSTIHIPKNPIHVNKTGEKSHRLIVGYQVASYNSVEPLLAMTLFFGIVRWRWCPFPSGSSCIINRARKARWFGHFFALLAFCTPPGPSPGPATGQLSTINHGCKFHRKLRALVISFTLLLPDNCKDGFSKLSDYFLPLWDIYYIKR